MVNQEKEETEEEEGMPDSEEDKEGNQQILTKLSEIESRIRLACAEENYDLAGGPILCMCIHL